jgi:DNA-binding LytR/AlgR family response regulator
MMQILIIEDEMLAAERMIDLIRKYDPNSSVAGPLRSVEKSVAWLKDNSPPDLILMDIQLEDGLSFEIFERTEVHSPVIFTTAYNQYTIKAFKVNSVDYLLKPIDYGELSLALDKLLTYFGPTEKEAIENKTLLYDKLLTQLGSRFKSRFVVKAGQHIRSIAVEDIMYFYSAGKSSFLCVSGGRNYDLDYSLDQVESLVDPEVFFRVNRKYIVRWDSIEDIVIYSGSRLKLKLKTPVDDDVLVSREKVKSFKEWLDR